MKSVEMSLSCSPHMSAVELEFILGRTVFIPYKLEGRWYSLTFCSEDGRRFTDLFRTED